MIPTMPPTPGSSSWNLRLPSGPPSRTLLPMDQQYRLGAGIQYSFNDNVTVGLAYQYFNGGDNNLDRQRGPLAGRIQGDYKSFEFHFVALNLRWRSDPEAAPAFCCPEPNRHRTRSTSLAGQSPGQAAEPRRRS
jgi:hypothetical protein